MDGQTPRKPKSKSSWTRRLVRATVVVAVLGLSVLAAVPWLLATGPARSLAVAAVNRALAPSRVEVAGLSASWRGPIRLSGLTLRNGKGKVLVAARRASWDRGLLALARDRRRLGTITVEQADVDIERRADGSIDLVEALSPPRPAPAAAPAGATAPANGPGMSVGLRVVSGTLRLTTPELSAPLVAGAVAFEANLPASPGRPLDWKLRLALPAGGTEAQTLGIDGTYDLYAATDPALRVRLHGENWPLAGAVAGVSAAARLVGGLELIKEGGKLRTSGDARLLDLEARGAMLQGDTLRLASVDGAWEVAQGSSGWAVRRLDVQSPVATLKASGAVGPDGTTPQVRLQGDLDLAALAKQVPHSLRLHEGLSLDKGAVNVRLDLKSEGGIQTAALEARVSDLAARHDGKAFTLREAAALDAQGSRGPTGFQVETCRLKTAFLDVSVKGDLEHGLTLGGAVDLGAIEAQFRDLIDFQGVELAGKGRMAGDYRKTGPTFVARYATELKGFKAAGLTAEPIERDRLRFDAAANGPIDPSGTPTGADVARVHLKSSRDDVTVTARFQAEAVALDARGSVPVTVSARDGQADVRLVGRWRGQAQRLDMDELRLGLRPQDPALAASGTVALAVRGSYDLAGDDLKLTPLPDSPGRPLALATEGLALHGFRTAPLAQRAGRVVLSADLEAVDRALVVWTGAEPNGLGGVVSGMVGLGAGDSGQLNLGGDLNVDNLTRLAADGKTRTPEGPVVLAYRARMEPGVDRIDFDRLIVASRYARIDAEGSLGEPTGRRVANLKGTIAPNWDGLTAIVRNATEPNARLNGNPRPFRLAGLLSAPTLPALLRGLDAEIAVELTSADVFGLRLGPAPLVLHCGGGNVTIDPVQTTLNGGTVTLKPGLSVEDDKGIALLLFDGTKLEGVAINDEVSRDVLRYVAPVLDKATHVTGKVNLTIQNGLIPLTGPPERTMTLNGQLAFNDVNFAPGPFANQVLSVAGKKDAPGLKLQQPVNLSIADSRVIQKGLEIPISGDAKLGIEGSVGFDETLDLRTSVPLTKAMLGQAAGLNDLIAGNRVVVPIAGTVSQPRINRQALQVALRELTRGIARKELSKEATGVLDRLGVPKEALDGLQKNDPNAVRNLGDQLLKRLAPPRGGSGR